MAGISALQKLSIRLVHFGPEGNRMNQTIISAIKATMIPMIDGCILTETSYVPTQRLLVFARPTV